MSSSSNTFLTLIPTAHRVAVINAFTSPEEALIPALAKTRRSSSTGTTESNIAEEPTDPSEIVESPTEEVSPQDTALASTAQKAVPGGFTFLKLGN